MRDDLSPVQDAYFVQAFVRRGSALAPSDLVSCGPDEDRAFRIGRSMKGRAAGVAFFKVDTSASGDQWTEIELLCTVGHVPEIAA